MVVVPVEVRVGGVQTRMIANLCLAALAVRDAAATNSSNDRRERFGRLAQ